MNMGPIVMEIESLRALTCVALRMGGMLCESDALIIADHLLDSELRGLEQGGVCCAIAVAKRLEKGHSAETIKITGEIISSALVGGGGNPGYLVGHKATTIVVQKASLSGLAIVAATNTWVTGMLSYHAEMATRENLVFVGFASSAWRVAPFGGSQPRFGTNPICIGFPSRGVPVIVDTATSAVAVG